MAAPQRPMRRAPQMRKTMPSRAAQVQRRAADAIPPASGQAEIRPTRPRADRPRSGCAGEPAASPGNRLPPAFVPFPACATSQLPAARRTSAQHSPDARPPGSGPTSAHIRDARLHPDLCPPAADVRVLPASRRRTDDNAEKRRPTRPTTCRIRVFPATPPPARFRSLTFSRQPRFRRLRADRRASPNALSEATFIRVRSTGLQFSARLRSSRAQPPPCFRSPRGFRLLPRAPLSLWFPRPIPRVFLAPFPAPSPHFCRTLSRLFAPHL